MWSQPPFPPMGCTALGRDGTGLPETLPIVSRNHGGGEQGGKEGALCLAWLCPVAPCPPQQRR